PLRLQLLVVQPMDLARLPVHVEHRAGDRVVYENSVARQIEDGPVALLRDPELLLRRLLLGHVLVDEDQLPDAAAGIPDREHEAANPPRPGSVRPVRYPAPVEEYGRQVDHLAGEATLQQIP